MKSKSNGYRSKNFVKRSNNASLEDEDVRKIRQMKDKLTIEEFADFYDVSTLVIKDVLEYNSYGHVQLEEENNE